jgi:hypothetical protein
MFAKARQAFPDPVFFDFPLNNKAFAGIEFLHKSMTLDLL